MKADIRERARELGFDECRFTSAQAPESAPYFQRWLARRHHGEMAYLERNASKRVDPQQVLPGAKTIVTLAASYSLRTAGQSGLESPASAHPAALCGFVARYARFRDYHKVLGERLKLLSGFMEELGGQGTRSLWYVDSGPVLERDLAQRAGLGFIGKHTNLVSRRLGNYIFLAEVLTTLEVAPDAPEPNRCGSCSRCLSACPTAAIIAPFQLDARRCISYLTIELKGPIPVEWRPAIGNRIYGCDDCLAVCPWNRFAREGQLMKMHARQELGAPELLDLLALDETAFARRFAGTPMLRARRRGLLRNVCVALGNLGDRRALPALEKAAQDLEPLVAEHARWALDRLGRG
ncbi:Epoxyqueuosine reductase [Verrucomicrobia bacterium]|nr:Epoxyqueuosine reductase [Verrucomicrobiota bacterium]